MDQTNAGKLALLFPGQGVATADHREAVADLRPDLLALAGKLCGGDPFARLTEGTEFAQPAAYCASLAGLTRLGEPEADFLAGHSLGEVAALAAAGAINDLDGVRIVAERGRRMSEAARESGRGGMLAVGAKRAQALELAGRHGLSLANENSPRQFVLSGPAPGIDGALAEAKASGMRAKRLAIAGAFHSSAMDDAVGPFLRFLDSIEFSAPRVPVISGVTGQPFMGDARALLTAALTAPVRWHDVLRRLHAAGVRRFVDVGPGRVLAGLVTRTLDGVSVETGEAVVHRV